MEERAELHARVTEYLRSHHTMTIATFDAVTGTPHAAHVFYSVEESLRVVFLSKKTSQHGRHIGKAAQVAVTVSEEYEHWRDIRGVQLWGVARLLERGAKVEALAVYFRRFPFARDLLGERGVTGGLRDVGVYRVDPARVGFTDNSCGVFGRETLELVRE